MTDYGVDGSKIAASLLSLGNLFAGIGTDYDERKLREKLGLMAEERQSTRDANEYDLGSQRLENDVVELGLRARDGDRSAALKLAEFVAGYDGRADAALAAGDPARGQWLHGLGADRGASLAPGLKLGVDLPGLETLRRRGGDGGVGGAGGVTGAPAVGAAPRDGEVEPMGVPDAGGVAGGTPSGVGGLAREALANRNFGGEATVLGPNGVAAGQMGGNPAPEPAPSGAGPAASGGGGGGRVADVVLGLGTASGLPPAAMEEAGVLRDLKNGRAKSGIRYTDAMGKESRSRTAATLAGLGNAGLTPEQELDVELESEIGVPKYDPKTPGARRNEAEIAANNARAAAAKRGGDGPTLRDRIMLQKMRDGVLKDTLRVVESEVEELRGKVERVEKVVGGKELGAIYREASGKRNPDVVKAIDDEAIRQGFTGRGKRADGTPFEGPGEQLYYELVQRQIELNNVKAEFKRRKIDPVLRQQMDETAPLDEAQ